MLSAHVHNWPSIKYELHGKDCQNVLNNVRDIPYTHMYSVADRYGGRKPKFYALWNRIKMQ